MKKFIAVLCLTAMLAGCGNTEESSSSEQGSSAPAASEEQTAEETTEEVLTPPVQSMEAAYRQVLDELKGSGAESFSVCDLTGGKGPEALVVVINDGDTVISKLYRYSEKTGEAELLANFNDYITYSSASQFISYGSYDSASGVDTTTFFSISDDNELITDTDLRRTYETINDEISGQFWKGEQTISEEEYTSEMRRLSAVPVKGIGSDFKVTDDVIGAVFDEYGTWQQAYSTYLLSCLSDVDEQDEASFSILDINGDGTPELFYAPGFYHVSPVKIFTFNSGLRCLGGFGTYGTISYYPENNEIFSSNMGMGYYSGSFYTLGSDFNFSLNLSFDDNTGAVGTGAVEKAVYDINGNQVDEKTYRDTIDSHVRLSSYDLGRSDLLTEENAKAVADGVYSEPVLRDAQYPEVTDGIPEKYKSILSKFYYSCQLDLTDIEITGSENISDNTFAIYDVDCDGKDELIINVTATSMAEMVTVIYGEDSSGEVKVELVTAPFYNAYDNGTIEVDDSHNQGISGRFWPYTVFRYDASSDDYKFYKYISAWDKEVYPEGFPEEFDKDGDGMVYYVNADYTDSIVDPIDFDEFSQWRNEERNGAMPVNIPSQNITEDVIS